MKQGRKQIILFGIVIAAVLAIALVYFARRNRAIAEEVRHKAIAREAD